MPDRRDPEDPTEYGAGVHHEPHPEEVREDHAGRFRKLGRRLIGQERVSAREVMGAMLEGGDKAKTEIVKAVAREVRSYLEELGLREFLSDYSLEVRASFNLRKLSEAEKAGPGALPPDPAVSDRPRPT